jgi:hypothetical protein
LSNEICEQEIRMGPAITPPVITVFVKKLAGSGCVYILAGKW